MLRGYPGSASFPWSRLLILRSLQGRDAQGPCSLPSQVVPSVEQGPAARIPHGRVSVATWTPAPGGHYWAPIPQDLGQGKAHARKGQAPWVGRGCDQQGFPGRPGEAEVLIRADFQGGGRTRGSGLQALGLSFLLIHSGPPVG